MGLWHEWGSTHVLLQSMKPIPVASSSEIWLPRDCSLPSHLPSISQGEHFLLEKRSGSFPFQKERRQFGSPKARRKWLLVIKRANRCRKRQSVILGRAWPALLATHWGQLDFPSSVSDNNSTQGRVAKQSYLCCKHSCKMQIMRMIRIYFH